MVRKNSAVSVTTVRGQGKIIAERRKRRRHKITSVHAEVRDILHSNPPTRENSINHSKVVAKNR